MSDTLQAEQKRARVRNPETLEPLKQARGLRDELVSDAHREADRRYAQLAGEAMERGESLTACAEALGLHRVTLHQLLERVRGSG